MFRYWEEITRNMLQHSPSLKKADGVMDDELDRLEFRDHFEGSEIYEQTVQRMLAAGLGTWLGVLTATASATLALWIRMVRRIRALGI